jgi:hypothetical protein
VDDRRALRALISPVDGETDGSFAITSTSWSPLGSRYDLPTVWAICFAAPSPPPLGCHVDHLGAGVIARPA